MSEVGRCPDGGTCHHRCWQRCFRVISGEPLSGVYTNDAWPVEVWHWHRDHDRPERLFGRFRDHFVYVLGTVNNESPEQAEKTYLNDAYRHALVHLLAQAADRALTHEYPPEMLSVRSSAPSAAWVRDYPQHSSEVPTWVERFVAPPAPAPPAPAQPGVVAPREDAEGTPGHSSAPPPPEPPPPPGSVSRPAPSEPQSAVAPEGPPEPPYDITDPASFTCPICGRTSYHPTDAAEGYCGACHDWTGR